MSNYADNILDKDGNPIYLEDKHLNDQTSQTTVATTDAVMLKDTNGAYHSIAKASFNEAVRAAMGSILTNFDKGTSITRIPGIDSSNDLGSATVANLASVLGVNNTRWDYFFDLRKDEVTTTEINATIGIWIVAPFTYTTEANQLVILVKNESGTRQFEILTTPWYSLTVDIDAETNHFKFSSNTWNPGARMGIRKIR